MQTSPKQKKMDMSRLRVLIVEDDQNTRATIRALLQEMGVNQIFDAKDGKSAKDMTDLAADLIDLIICDWNMPELTGIDYLKRFRASYPHFPFIMITGRSDVNSIMDAKNAGVSAYIRKPFSMRDLESKIISVFSK